MRICKKFLTILMLVTLCMSMWGCGGSKNDGDEKTTAEQETKEKSIDEIFGYMIVDDGIRLLTYKDTGKKVVIPSKIKGIPVVEIEERIFNGCDFIEDITIPNTVKRIERDAFTGTKWYEQVPSNTVVGDGVLIKIDSNAEELVIDENVKRIMEGILVEKCPKKVIVNSPNIEDDNLLQGSRSIEHLVIGEKVTEIKGIANGCSSLKSVEFSQNLSIIGEKSFYDCKGLTSLVIPDNVEYIENEAFSHCTELEEIALPKGVKLITRRSKGYGERYSSCFEGCIKLEKIILTGMVELDLETFSGTPFYNNLLKQSGDYIIVGDSLVGYKGNGNMNIPNGVKLISCVTRYVDDNQDTGFTDPDGDGTFTKGGTIKKLTIPKSVEKIGKYAFESGFYDLDKLTIPNNVKIIGDSAFYGVDVDIMYIEEGIESMGDIFGAESCIDTLVLPKTLKEMYSLPWSIKKIIGEKGTLAEEIAIKNNIEFEEK